MFFQALVVFSRPVLCLSDLSRFFQALVVCFRP